MRVVLLADGVIGATICVLTLTNNVHVRHDQHGCSGTFQQLAGGSCEIMDKLSTARSENENITVEEISSGTLNPAA